MRRLLLAVQAVVFFVFPGVSVGGLDPAFPGLAPATAFGRPGITNDNVSAMCVDCHGLGPLTGRSAHFVAQPTRGTLGQSAKERTVAWTGSGRTSKFGNFSTWTSVATTGDLICESCHNVVTNVAGGNNLVEYSSLSSPRPTQPNSLTSATTTLCEGCHTTETLSPLPGLLGHHPMTGDSTSSGAALSTADTVSTRGFVDNVTEVGGTGSEVRYPGTDKLSCISCHGNGHNAYVQTGARILRKGFSRNPASPGAGVSGTDNSGIDRQYDIDPSGATRLITNSAPLCDACHKYDD